MYLTGREVVLASAKNQQLMKQLAYNSHLSSKWPFIYSLENYTHYNKQTSEAIRKASEAFKNIQRARSFIIN